MMDSLNSLFAHCLMKRFEEKDPNFLYYVGILNLGMPLIVKNPQFNKLVAEFFDHWYLLAVGRGNRFHFGTEGFLSRFSSSPNINTRITPFLEAPYKYLATKFRFTDLGPVQVLKQ